MGAARYVGRVGGLAVALGVGVGLFAAAGAAWADSPDDGGQAAATHNSADRASRGPAATKNTGAAARTGQSARPAASVSRAAAKSSSASDPAPSEAVEPVVDVAPDPAEDTTDPVAVPTGLVDTGTEDPTPLMYATGAGASATTNNGVTVNPTTTVVNGVWTGNLQATSATGQELKYTYVGTSSGGKLDLGNVPITPGGSVKDPQSYTLLPYATWLDGGGAPVQVFTVRVSENTAFDKFVTGLPLIGLVASPIISLLQQAPLISNLLAPIIGGSVLAAISIDTSLPTDPVAYTYKVTSFDGVQISTDFFPKNGLVAGESAYTLLNGPGLGGAGATDPYATNSTSGTVPGLALLRTGYNVITWDPRGEFASGGILELDNPFYEGRDVSALIDWAGSNTYTPAVMNGTNDPAIGMIGGSYGGGIQMSTVDPRIDAINPSIAWNSLNESLYPSQIFKTAWANVFGLSLLTTGARVNGEVYPALITGNLIGLISETAQSVLGSSGPTALLNQLQAPTLLQQGIVDALFPLVQSTENAQGILANPYGVPVKMIWFCGGHGICLDTGVDQVRQNTLMFTYDIAWMDKYVKGLPIPDAFTPNFQWWDQLGNRWTSDLYPFSDGFNQPAPLTETSAGGQLAVLPFAIGGSGPNTTSCAIAAGCSWPLNQTFATAAPMAINVPITPTTGQQIVGAPSVSFTYSGIGTARAVYGQIVDNTTGRVLGNIATPIPVTLDGQPHDVSVAIADIVYTAGPSPSLTLQIVGSATQYLNSSFGLLDISDVVVDLPLRALPTVGALV